MGSSSGGEQDVLAWIRARAGGHLVRLRGHAVMVVAALVCVLVCAAPALANGPEGPFAVFKQCPRFTEGVRFCLLSQIEGGGVQIGNGGVAIVSPITLQGGYSRDDETGAETFFGALDGETLSRTPQPVPGGLGSLIDCNEIAGKGFLQRVFRRACQAVLDNPALRGLSATTELAEPASDIAISSDSLINEEGVGLSLPVKIHLESPLLGNACDIGSGSDPIVLNLTTGTSGPIAGKLGHVTYGTFEGLTYTEVTENGMVDSTFPVPTANGCGGILSSLIDPIINAKLGLPSPAGHNLAIQTGKLELTLAEHVIESEHTTSPHEREHNPERGHGREEWGHEGEEERNHAPHHWHH
jgi:hypothetical protein